MIRSLTILASCLAFAAAVPAQEREVLRLVDTIRLPDVRGRIDHLGVDVKGKRIFLAALEKNTIEVVDVASGRVARTLAGFAKPQGVLYVQELERLFVASGKDGSVKAYDGATLELAAAATVSLGADAIGYDARAREIYVGSGGGDAGKENGDLTVFDAKTLKQVAAYSTDAHAGGSVAETRGSRMFVLVPEKGQVVTIDRARREQTAKWSIAGIEKNVAIEIDEASRRIFLGVRNPASVVVIDADSGRAIASVPAVGTLDGLSFDAANRRAYVSGGEGFVDVIQQVDPDKYVRTARVATVSGARTSLFVPEWKRFFVALPAAGERAAELRVYEAIP
jgi:DNA-binding beta-propeller fold protein YncE